MSIKFLVLGGGFRVGGGGGKCRFYFYGRGDFSDIGSGANRRRNHTESRDFWCTERVLSKASAQSGHNAYATQASPSQISRVLLLAGVQPFNSRMAHNNPEIPKNTVFTRTFSKSSRELFEKVPVTRVRNPAEIVQKKLVQMNLFILGGFFRVDFSPVIYRDKEVLSLCFESR